MWKEIIDDAGIKPKLCNEIDCCIVICVIEGECPLCGKGLMEHVEKTYPPKKVICKGCRMEGTGMRMLHAYVDFINKCIEKGATNGTSL